MLHERLEVIRHLMDFRSCLTHGERLWRSAHEEVTRLLEVPARSTHITLSASSEELQSLGGVEYEIVVLSDHQLGPVEAASCVLRRVRSFVPEG